MKRMTLSIKILTIPIMLALLCCVAGCYCLMPWEWWDHDSHHDGERGYHRGHDGDGHHRDGERGDHHHDGDRD